MTSKMTHRSSLPEKKRLQRSTKEELSVVDEVHSWQDDDVPNLLPENELWDLLDADFVTNETSDTIDLNDLYPIPVQMLAAGSQIVPENDDGSTYVEDYSTTKNSQRSSSRKRRYMYNTEAPLKKVERNAVVGPDSMQMKAIKRVLVYLEETVDEDPGLLSMVQEVTRQCEIRHRRGESKYQHLPGAIFEMLVDAVGGTTFGRLYSKSKNFHHSRIQSMGEEPGQLVEKVELTSQSIGVQTPTRCILSTAVAYGLHLATLMKKEDDNALGQDENSVEKIIQDGADAVSSMNEKDRQEFWEHFLACDCLTKKTSQITAV